MVEPIFILSLPRSGSTLLQRILLTSGQCSTLGETSLLLRFLGEHDRVVRYASYRESNLDVSMQDMRKHDPGFDKTYIQGVNRMMMGIYERLADGKPYFIDKTPRYALICDEIMEAFPDAKYILLWRHPLAVASSISSTFFEDKWVFDDFNVDFEWGLDRLHQFSRKYRSKICEIRYEDLVSNPGQALASIEQYLGWKGLAKQAENLPSSAGGSLGDPTGTKKYNKLTSDSSNKWKTKYQNWYRCRWAQDFLNQPRTDYLRDLGYEFPEEIRNKSLTYQFFDGLREFLYARKLEKKHRNRCYKYCSKYFIYPRNLSYLSKEKLSRSK